jgi:hypothetical protein
MVGDSDEWRVVSEKKRGSDPSQRAQIREDLEKKERCENIERDGIPKWNDWSYQRRGVYPLFLRM